MHRGQRGWNLRFLRGSCIGRLVFLVVLLTSGPLGGSSLFATSVIPISDGELYRRADVIVHGIVLSSETVEDARGRPQTVTNIEPLAILKGHLTGNLTLRQAGGRLPDGRFFELPGRPEYVPGREVIVFAISRPEGDYQTAEMLLGKFEVWQDQQGTRFPLPDLARGVHPGVVVRRDPGDQGEDARRPRLLSRFLDFLRNGARSAGDLTGKPVGELTPVLHPNKAGQKTPLWGNIGGLWRWNNGATDAWTLDGMANMTGGGIAEATNALATWTDDPTSAINYTVGSGTDRIHLNVSSNSNCGWSTCISGSGVIACGGPSGSGTNTWRGESYTTITKGEVWLRSFCTFDEFSSTIVQSVLEHELGHTLGPGHSDQDVSPHDVCRGDEDAAIMRSTAQDRTSLGTDDQDAIRWIYGDGGASCYDFLDVPPSHPFYSYIAKMAKNGITAGCGGNKYCPDASVTRAQMAVFLLKGKYGSGYAPPACTGLFGDVPCPSGFAADWIEQLYNEGITGGCSTSPPLYCPNDAVTRAQMAVFLLKAEHGPGYAPPACNGIFQDVECTPTPAFAVDWIEQLYLEGVTGGCSSSPLRYCPDNPNTRGQMAVFLVKTFNLP
ncbi:MAG: S-layer homology domain-containing protein [Thermoanaerobaculia bacterium]